MADTFGIEATKRPITLYKHCGFVQSITTTSEIPSGTTVSILVEKANGESITTLEATVAATSVDWSISETVIGTIPTGCKYYMIVTFPGQFPRPWFEGPVKLK